MLRAYFDDSGTHRDSEIVTVGGLIGTVAQWEEFERRWGALLACPLPGKPRLKMFHLSPCNAKDGEFTGYSDAECDAVTHDFRQILIETKLISTASAIDKKAWDELVIGAHREWLGDALDVCVENSLSEAFKIAGAHPEGNMIAAVFDRGIWTPRLKQVTEGYTYQMGSPRIVSVNFLSVEDALPLQGADISATENYWHAIKVMRNGIGAQPRAHMQHYLNNMFAEGFMIDRARIVEMLPEIERQVQALGGQSC
ncbi:MAG TPA: hypothetical protein VGR45_08300 [Stellaceae bacterium]|nr:hypothetical protein [Stellaceae bacterium]